MWDIVIAGMVGVMCGAGSVSAVWLYFQRIPKKQSVIAVTGQDAVLGRVIWMSGDREDEIVDKAAQLNA